jgi:hypothetical protein
MSAGVAVVVPDQSDASASAPAAQAAARSNPERFAGPSRDDSSASQPAAPKLHLEPAIGVTVMRLVHDEATSPSAASEPAKAGPKIFEAGNETSVVLLNNPPSSNGGEKSADASHDRGADAAAQPSTAGDDRHASGAFADASSSSAHSKAASDDSNAPSSGADAVSARTSGGMPISFIVGDARAAGAATPNDARASGDARPAGGERSASDAAAVTLLASPGAGAPPGAEPSQCDVEILHKKPRSAVREVATFKLDGEPVERDQIMALLKRRACEAGANALVLKQSDSAAGTYHVEAVALRIESAKPAGKPVRKTIEVPLPSKPVPKTITVDPDAPG